MKRTTLLFAKQRWLLFAVLLLCSGALWAQNQITVKGKIVDNKGETIIGAAVMVKGTTVGTATDLDGLYEIKAPSNGVLFIKYVGYKSKEVAINGKTRIDITIEEDAVALNEVVAVGYATGSKRTISGAVQKVSKEDMNVGVVNTPLSSIKGKVAGVVIQKNGGDPTQAPSVRVRGTTSLSGGNDPLVIIDGVFGDLSLLNALAPSDIESFTILKDASETAQYGSRGASGVIVVTTAKGKIGAANLSYEGNFGVESIYKNIEMLSAAQYRQAVADRNLTTALDAGFSTNFMKAMQRTGFTQNHKVSFGAGNETSNYRASIGVISQEGVIKTSDMNNFTGKFDATQRMFEDKLRLDMGIFASMKQNNYVNDAQKTFYSAAAFNPTFPLGQKEDGTWWEDPNANEVDNPMGRLSIQDNEKNAFANLHAKASWDFTKALRLTLFGSYTYNNKVNSVYVPLNTKQGIRDTGGRASKSQNTSESTMGNATLTYKETFGKSFIDVLLLAEAQSYRYNGFNATSRSFGTDYFGYDNLGAGAVVKYGDVGSYNNGYQLASFMGRFNYVFDDKYIATVNIRTDGSSKLGANNKWGFFPSGSLAYAISREEFMKNLKWLNDLKIRAGYGLTGNQDAISAYNSLELMVPQGITTVNGKPVVTYGIARNANPDLRWETKKMFDVGFDLSILNNKVSITADYYHSLTSGLLYNYKVPVPPFLYPSLLANLGSMQNDGVELSITYKAIDTKNHTLQITANGTYQRNELKSLSGSYMGEPLSAPQYMSLGGINGAGFIGGNNQVVYQIVGQPVGVFYLPKADGLKDFGKAGRKYDIVNLDDDPAINLNDGKDRYIAGQATPKVFIGANISYRFKRFDIQTQINGAFGHKIYNGTSLTYMNMNQFPTYNVLKGAPEMNIKDSKVTDYWLEKGDYAHIEYITAGYTFNTEKYKKWINTLRLTASVNNVFTFTGYSGLSPLINSTVVGYDMGIDDKRFYPLSRTYSIGLSLNF